MVNNPIPRSYQPLNSPVQRYTHGLILSGISTFHWDQGDGMKAQFRHATSPAGTSPATSGGFIERWGFLTNQQSRILRSGD